MATMVGILALVLFVMLFAALWYLAHLQVEVRAMNERMASMERSQGTVGQELSHARDRLTQLQTEAHSRLAIDQAMAESVRRLDMIIAGTHSKGVAGENILDLVFAQLPPDWQERNFTVGNKTVEFALRLPNNRVLPIDSKWPATDLLEKFARCEDPGERQQLKRQIEAVVRDKVREVRKYLDPDLTADFAIAAVPDAVLELCAAVQCDCFRQSVVLISYSMFVPYLLLVFQTYLNSSRGIDLEKLPGQLRVAQEGVREMQEELQGRFARAFTMLDNSQRFMSTQLSRINGSLTSIQVEADAPIEYTDGAALPAHDDGDLPLISRP
jgi:DNA recombination protein RmuC